MILTMGMGGGLAGGSYAQTALPNDGAPSAQSIAAPLIGQVSLQSSPLSTTVADNQPHFTLVPSVRTVYDTNVLHYFDFGGVPRGNIRVTPGLDLDYRRLLGRVDLSVSGSAGYDFNSRYKFLNQSRIDVTGTARAPVGAICATTAKVTYDQRRFAPGDTQAAIGSTSVTQIYDVIVSCQRRAGFSPVVEGHYRSADDNQSKVFDYQQYVGSLGIAFAQPSLGTLTLSATGAQLRRPTLVSVVGISDDTNVYSVSLGLNRSVSPRVQINIAGGITKADPRRASVPGFVGASYSGQIQWLPIPFFTISGTAVRAVTNQAGISATYVIREDYTISAQQQISAKSRVGLAGSRSKSDFRGEDLTPGLIPIRADRSTAISTSYNYDLTRKLRLGFGVSHVWRRADVMFYNYTSTVVSSSIGAHF